MRQQHNQIIGEGISCSPRAAPIIRNCKDLAIVRKPNAENYNASLSSTFQFIVKHTELRQQHNQISGEGNSFSTQVAPIIENYNDFNTVVLTDGYTDTLDLSRLKGRVLMITVGVKVPISRTNNKVKQIVLENTH